MTTILEYAFRDIQRSASCTIATCKFCILAKKIIKGSKKSTYNFGRHIKKCHAYHYKQYELSSSKVETATGNEGTIIDCLAMPNESNEIRNHDVDNNADIVSAQLTEGSATKVDAISDPVINNPDVLAKATDNSETVSELVAEQDICLDSQINVDVLENDTITSSVELASSRKNNGLPNSTIQTFLTKKKCECCLTLDYLQSMTQDGIRNSMSKCQHINKDTCCCASKKTLPFSGQMVTVNCDDIGENTSVSQNLEFIACKFDHSSKKTLYYCLICARYSNMNSRKTAANEDWISGISFQDKKTKTMYAKRHIGSQIHKTALQNSLYVDHKQKRLGLPQSEERAQATKALLTTSMLLASNALPYRILPQICSLFQLVCPKDEPNPLGNKHHCHNSMPKLLKANYDSYKSSMNMYYLTHNQFTKQKRLANIAADKGTSPKDILPGKQ
jgi:hypothetical protein